MSTFGQTTPNARAQQGSAPKDNPTAEQIAAAEGEKTEGENTIPATDPNKPTDTLDENASETEDRHIASTELSAKDVTDPDTQADTPLAEQTGEDIVPGAATGPDASGTILNDHGKVAHAPPGSMNAAFNGVQEDAAGHVDSVGTDNSDRSNTRV